MQNHSQPYSKSLSRVTANNLFSYSNSINVLTFKVIAEAEIPCKHLLQKLCIHGSASGSLYKSMHIEQVT